MAKAPLLPTDEPSSTTQVQPDLVVRPIKHSRTGPFMWLMVPLVASVVTWALSGDAWFSHMTYTAGVIGGIVLTGSAGLILATFSRGRNDGIERAYSAHLEELSQRLRNLAYKDSLTDLYNHRYFYEQLTHEVERAQRYARPVSVILLDLDNFKMVNDNYGHLMGDKLLALIGQVIKDQVRAADIPARYGGDEFAIILPDTPRAAAEATAWKLAGAVASGRTNAGPLGESFPLGASFGVASCPEDARTVSELLQAADSRAYTEKTAKKQAAKLAEEQAASA